MRVVYIICKSVTTTTGLLTSRTTFIRIFNVVNKTADDFFCWNLQLQLNSCSFTLLCTHFITTLHTILFYYYCSKKFHLFVKEMLELNLKLFKRRTHMHVLTFLIKCRSNFFSALLFAYSLHQFKSKATHVLLHITSLHITHKHAAVSH